jgi:signal transduction histidine kinase
MPLTRILWEGESEGCIDFSKLFKYLEGQFRLSAFSFLWRNTEGLAGDWRGTPLRIKSSAICYRRLERTLAPFQGPVPGMGPRASLYPVLLDREWVGCIATFGNQRKGSKNLSFEKKGLPFLARVLGTLIENHRLWKMLEKMDRQSALGFLSAGIIHEIRNPLTALSTLVQLLPQKKNDPAFMDSFQPLMLKELDRLELLTDQSLQFARTGTPAKGKVDLQETLERISQLIRPSLGRKRIQLRIKTEPGIKIKVNPAQLESLILNLMKNAISAVGDKGFIQVSAKRTIRGGGR